MKICVLYQVDENKSAGLKLARHAYVLMRKNVTPLFMHWS